MVKYKVLIVDNEGTIIDSMDVDDDSYCSRNGVLTVAKFEVDRNGHLND